MIGEHPEACVTQPSLLASRLDELTSVVRACLPWSPLDFIRGISQTGDRAVQFEPILRKVDTADDLRIVCTSASDAEVAVCAERLPWDSSFFGYHVAKLHGVFPLTRVGFSPNADYAPAIDALVQLARSRGIRYLFGVVDSRDLPTSRALTASGFTLIETRLSYHRSLSDYEYPRRFRCRRATGADVESLTALARSVENPYDRFNADPFIAREDTLRLMTTWLRASVLEGFADATFIPDSSNPGAVCTVKYHEDKRVAWGTSIAQLVLAMASPRAGTSLVGTISEVHYHLKDVGVDHVFFSTQIANRSAVRVAEHLGYKFGKGDYVFRLVL